jgi:hypothetical protein
VDHVRFEETITSTSHSEPHSDLEAIPQEAIPQLELEPETEDPQMSVAVSLGLLVAVTVVRCLNFCGHCYGVNNRSLKCNCSLLLLLQSSS